MQKVSSDWLEIATKLWIMHIGLLSADKWIKTLNKDWTQKDYKWTFHQFLFNDGFSARTNYPKLLAGRNQLLEMCKITEKWF